VCADGLHGFRYEKITLDALPGDAPYAEPYGEVDLNGASLDFSAYLGTPSSYLGWFDSSDASLNRYWYDASYTNELVTDHFEPGSVEPRGADSPTLDGKLVLMDGAKRDRDPYDGDLAVSGLADYLTHDEGSAVTNVLADLANHQSADGYIPPASINNYTLPLFEYPLYWAIDSWEYVLYHGVDGYGRQYYPNLVKLLNTWYPSVTDSRGLLDKGMNGTGGFGDYAFLPRSGEVTYYNDLYVLALHDGARLAAALGDSTNAAAWRQRATTVSDAINQYLWDPSAGAYLDSSSGPVSHPQDGNAWAVVAGVARGARAQSALDYLSAHTQTPYGNAFWDNDTVQSDGTTRVYAFTSYPDIVARFAAGQVGSALNEIGRLYGCMTAGDPGLTDWEGITTGCQPYEGAYTSMAHGWSTGILPALTNELLGVAPTGPGFSRWVFSPYPGSVAWTEGQVPTPYGPIVAKWKQGNGTFDMQITAPDQTAGRIDVPAVGGANAVTVNGVTHRGAAGGGAGGRVYIDVPRSGSARANGVRVYTVVARARG
jgi:Bacterial alpha-L-rhamnosidase C-terminal domain/Bacterial alpha-L-rhamnosidase 6 hairpin glycosidase domain